MKTREQLQRAFRESRSGEVGGIALRLLDAIEKAQAELGVPTPEYPAPVANAYEILQRALEGNDFKNPE